MEAVALQNVFVKEQDSKVEITLWSMDWKIDIVWAGMKTSWISLYISIRTLGWLRAIRLDFQADLHPFIFLIYSELNFVHVIR